MMSFFWTCAALGAFISFIMKALSKTITDRWFVMTRVIVSWATFLFAVLGMLGFIF